MEDNKEKRQTRSKTVKGCFKPDDLDESHWDLIIDDNYAPPRKRGRMVKFVEEPLNLNCSWDFCNEYFTDFYKYNRHVMEHIENFQSPEYDLKCYWINCEYVAFSYANLYHHVGYHAYHEKLKSIGRNVEERCDLPNCTQAQKFQFPIAPNGYDCEWEYCNENFYTVYKFFDHMRVHIHHNPRGPKEGDINCCWKGCSSGKFSNLYKLAEHIRIHTKEKLIACPTCGNLFACKTKFCDHRKRQLPQELQSFLCSQCSKYFPTERLLRDHMRLHINHYKCSMCEMTCPKPSILAKHIRYRHLNEKPYKCSQCSYRCVSKHNLDYHVRKHEDKAFQCDDCDFKCRSAYGLDNHNKKCHNKGASNVYECHSCKKQFKRGGILTKHLMRVHKYHWPSGHSRFRYKLDSDGKYRLQTVRYETLDVTEEIIKSNTREQCVDKTEYRYNLQRKPIHNCRVEQFEVKVNDSTEEGNVDNVDEVDGVDEAGNEMFKDEQKHVLSAPEEKSVLITIDDVDAKGNVLKSQVIKSSEIICSDIAEMESISSDIFDEFVQEDVNSEED